MAYNSNFRSSEITGANPVTITNEAQVVVDLGYKSAGSRGVLLSEAPLKESPSTIVMTVGGTTFTEVDISAFTGAANTFAVEYASNSGVILLPPGTALGTATTTTYKGLGSVATIESKRYNPDGLVTAPSVSFEDDPDTGLYRIGANNMGFAAGGVQTSQLNSLGVLNGSLGADYRNLIKSTVFNIPFSTSFSIPSTATTQRAIGFNVSYTPAASNSRLKINTNFNAFCDANTTIFCYLYITATALANGAAITGGTMASPTSGLVIGGSSGGSIALVAANNNVYTFTTSSTAQIFINVILQLNQAVGTNVFNVMTTRNSIIIEEYV